MVIPVNGRAEIVEFIRVATAQDEDGFDSEGEITGEKADELVKLNDIVLLYIFTKGSKPCLHFYPEWISIETSLQFLNIRGSRIVLRSIDAATVTELTRSLFDLTKDDARTYPTLVLFHNQSRHTFAGELEHDAVVHWISKEVNVDEDAVDTDKIELKVQDEIDLINLLENSNIANIE